MKPVSLKFTAFGPYLEEQHIDFSALNNAGLFLISGETGSGKTVILDAITYSLYGKSSGGVRGDIYAMRCLNAPDSVNTEVEYIFDVHNRRYKFTRTLKYGRKNLNASQNVLVMNDEGIFEPLFENPKISDLENTAVQLLGLTYEQFKQVIILPQGQFEQLLTSNSKDKEKILTSLFGTEKWAAAARILYDKAAAREKELSSEKDAAAKLLADNGCDNIDGLHSLLCEKKNFLSEKTKEYDTADKQLKRDRKSAEEQRLVHDSFLRLEKSKAEYDALTEKNEHISALKARLEKSLTAEKIKSVYDALSAAEKEKNERQKALDTARNSEEEKKQALEAVEENIKSAERERGIYADNKKRLDSLTATAELYETADLLFKKLKSSEKKISIAESSVKAAEQAAEKTAAEKDRLADLKKTLYNENTNLVNKYISNFCSNLAAGLNEGVPCPVCGSTHHPAPAENPPEKETVTEQMLDEAENRLKLNDAAIEKNEREHSGNMEALNSAKDNLAALRTETEKLKAEYGAVIKNTDNSIKSAEELKVQISTLKASILAYEKKTQTLSEKHRNLSAEYAAESSAAKIALSEYDKADKNRTETAEKFKMALKKSGFDNENEFVSSLLPESDKTAFSEEISQHSINKESLLKNISELNTSLDGIEKPDMDALENQLAEAEKKCAALLEEKAKTESECERLDKLYISLKKRLSAIEKSAARAEEDMRFAKRLRGDNGIGLQRYVLGIMLTSVTNEANRLLENVHGGRYKLYRSLDASGSSRIKGLEFSVYDSMSAKKRSVTTLSGGEKFLTALSLSIGLSAVVRAQSGGIEMGAMFIDEGFGTLDSSSVADALTVLSAMNRSNAAVGIISHVDALKENISAGIEITKTSAGSTLKIKE